MSINFIPNDPDAPAPPMRVVKPRADRPATRAGFRLIGAVPEGVYDPQAQPDQFLFWQCREGALAALEAWEEIIGAGFSAWQAGKKIDLQPDFGADANAYYDRQSLKFFHFTTGGKTFYSGASTDVVAHEAGHGILDAIRPELMSSSVFEINAFHEAFGDCVAVLTALHDKTTRTTVLADARKKNFVEATLENLAACVKRGIAQGDIPSTSLNASAPRRAKNTHQWQLPSTLPDPGDSNDRPAKLINEVHSFGQLFSGCFYDAILNIFTRLGGATEGQLLKAARISGLLLAKAVAVAPLDVRFFREVGRAMVKIDESDNGGANREEIKGAFEAHNIPLGVGAMLAPVAALSGAAPKLWAARASVSPSVKKDLLGRIGGSGRVTTSAMRIGDESFAQVLHERLVSVGDVDPRLAGVVAIAHESVLVGSSGGRAAILGTLPDSSSVDGEVETFVRSLVKRGAIDFGGQSKRAVAAADVDHPGVTHRIKVVRGEKVLVRFRYACGFC